MTMQLGDDGTLDTVIVCSECGEEFRFNYDGADESREDDETRTDEEDYDAFVARAKEQAANDHECDSQDRTLPIETPAETMASVVENRK